MISDIYILYWDEFKLDQARPHSHSEVQLCWVWINFPNLEPLCSNHLHMATLTSRPKPRASGGHKWFPMSWNNSQEFYRSLGNAQDDSLSYLRIFQWLMIILCIPCSSIILCINTRLCLHRNTIILSLLNRSQTKNISEHNRFGHTIKIVYWLALYCL
jgi:hypothetical protein